MGRKLIGKKPKPATLRQRRWRKRVAQGKIKAEARRKASRNAAPLPDGMELRVGKAQDMFHDVVDNSVAAIITDPPYGNAAEQLYRWLARLAKRVLIPGGSLICFTGQGTLPRDLAIFSEHLKYQWVLDLRHIHAQKLFGAGIICGWKPILWFVKGSRRGKTLLPDVLRPTARDKADHAWSQGDGGVWPLVEHLTEPGELILDPFCAGGEWGRIAASMGRRWIGCDLEWGGTETLIAA